MTYIFTLLLILWLAAPVGAETQFGCATIPQGKKCTFSHQQLAQMDQDYACLAQMEAAMKAMEPFNKQSWWKHGEQYVQTFFPFKDAADKRKWEQATEQWDAAKPCWREK